MTKKVGFAFSSKDRVEFSRRSLESIDSPGGFKLIWIDGSTTPEGRLLQGQTTMRHAPIVETHNNVVGGADVAIAYGLRRLLDLGYDYCGLIENDVIFTSGWFEKLMGLFKAGAKSGLIVGAATVRTFASRCLDVRSGYATLWNLGAGMALFTREAAKIVLENYRTRTAQEISAFFQEEFSNNLRDVWELWMDQPDRQLGSDWGYSLELYKHGLVSLGSIPSYCSDLDFDPRMALRSHYL
jgi:hypothetical protein